MQWTKKLLDTFKEDINKNRQKRSPCKFWVNGKFVRLNSGKSLWNMIGHCRNAIINHIETVLGFHTYEGKEVKKLVASIPVVYQDEQPRPDICIVRTDDFITW